MMNKQKENPMKIEITKTSVGYHVVGMHDDLMIDHVFDTIEEVYETLDEMEIDNNSIIFI